MASETDQDPTRARGVPRGRHAPPLAVRLGVQRTRLLEAAASVFARSGYAEATAEAIAREASMSKATFYEHFANKEDAIVALFDAAAEQVLGEMAEAVGAASDEPRERLRAGLRAFLGALAANPEPAQTLLVEIIGAGPRAAERRDAILERYAEVVDGENARATSHHGTPRFAGPDDAFAIVGAIFELASRQLRLGRPEDVRDLEPLILRLMEGLAGSGAG